jgi:hypothetical protein
VLLLPVAADPIKGNMNCFVDDDDDDDDGIPNTRVVF